MYNGHFHISHFAKNYTPFQLLMLVVHDEMDIYLPIKCNGNVFILVLIFTIIWILYNYNISNIISTKIILKAVKGTPNKKLIIAFLTESLTLVHF